MVWRLSSNSVRPLALKALLRFNQQMNPHIDFPQLVSALSGSDFAGTPLGSFKVENNKRFFVNPQLLVEEALGDLESSVVLISARGAAGKSRAAEELSRQLGAPLWKLEQDKAVGGTSLSFVLGKYLDSTSIESALASFNSPTILIDSLDEARARVSGTSWSEFLQSLVEAIHFGCRFILFGRERTLEEVWVGLDDASVSTAWLEISHFGPNERLEYVDGMVSLRSRSGTPLNGPYYQAARDAVLTSIVSSVPGGAADTFAGYAPVLDAVAAVLLREENHFAVSRSFGESNGLARHLGELKHVLDDLLIRDQLKMAPVATQLGLAPSSVYTPEEQIDWLCHDLEGGPEPELRHIADPRVRADYIDNVRPFLNDHPFRNDAKWASTVFTAYTASQRFGTTIDGQRLIDIGNDSSLLFDLLALQSEELLIDEWQFAALHASITAGEFSGALATVTASEVDGGEFTGAMSVLRAGIPSQTALTLISESPQVVRLFGPLEGLTFSTSCEVRIPARDTPTVLGPDLFLRCGSLAIEGYSVEFAHRAAPATSHDAPNGVVIFEVDSRVELPGAIARDPWPGDFELHVPDSTTLPYPWVNYRQTLILTEKADPNDRAVRLLRMLMNLTRNHGHTGERATFTMKLQGRQSVKGTEFQAALKVLVRRGVVRVASDMIYVREEYERYRFSGKFTPGQRTIDDVWDVWRPVAEEIAQHLS
ncbi:hypothetical protein AB0I91_34920 [Actinosynnema sp. NPDC049800]